MSECKICSQELTIELDADSFDEATSSLVGEAQTAPDDLLLMCGCHFHWQCLLDESTQICLSLACPECENSIVTGPSSGFPEPRVLTQYKNEGGIQNDLDILPLLQEEAHLEANPSARPARAFMTLCTEGDVTGIIELLQALSSDDEEETMTPSDLLRFQDPLDGEMTGLHKAIENSQQETVWLLLWLASKLPTEVFPEEVQAAAATLGAGRELADGADVRDLRDQKGRRAEDVAKEVGGVWGGLVVSGILRS